MPPPLPARVVLALLALGVVAPACTPGRRAITPTTTGSNLRGLPRGRMTPPPFPGTDLARSSRRPPVDSPLGGLRPPSDPATIAASAAAPAR